jgi:hypothetical protein
MALNVGFSGSPLRLRSAKSGHGLDSLLVGARSRMTQLRVRRSA